MTLAPGEPTAPAAHHRVVSIQQLFADEAVGPCPLGRLIDFRLRGIQASAEDVLVDRVVEQRGLLGDNPDPPPQVAQPHLA